jgi:formylglycine-generating enzyme required for sulfatase activity
VTAGDRSRVELEDLLSYRRLVIVGDPGAGKTTFLCRIALELSKAWLRWEHAQAGIVVPTPDVAEPGSQATASFFARLAAALRRSPGEVVAGTGARSPAAAGSRQSVEESEPRLPVLIRIAELSEHIRKCRARADCDGPTAEDSPAWLVHFLNQQSKENKWGLEAAFFEQRLEGGSALLLLDGLDEPPGTIEREAMARLFEKATHAYQRCRFVVTTRPLAYVGKAVLEGFEEAQIEPLEPEDVEGFLGHWCRALFPESEEEAGRHLRELAEALRSTAEIRLMARNPVMLTALAVVHWNERRLPEQRAELYKSILNWLARSRERRRGREPAERCLRLLGHLALGMQNRPGGRLVEVSIREAADGLVDQFRAEGEALSRALDFIAQEEVDSGIIVSQGTKVRFKHLTFQEYLAAKAIGGLEDPEQYKLLLTDDKIYRPEWREVALLLAGVLYETGEPKVDRLVTEVLKRLEEPASLAERAKCAGLLGAMVRDLRTLGYKPADRRYEETLQSVLGIFDVQKAASVDFQVRLEAAGALGQAGDPRLEENNWIRIEAGKFLMGAQKQDSSQPNFDPDAWDDESPAHEVYLEAYEIARYPVTVQEFREFLDDEEGYKSERWWRAGGFGKTNGPDDWDGQVVHPNRPVVNVSWYEAAAYCAWATERLGGEVRLPTEAEWERAARGREGRKYPWGDEEPDTERANYDEGKVGHTTPVGLYPRGETPEGIRDLAGNVYEWVADWYGEDYYGKSPGSNPRGPESGEARVLRGGCWSSYPLLLRAAFRNWIGPVDRGDDIGLRCCREVIP